MVAGPELQVRIDRLDGTTVVVSANGVLDSGSYLTLRTALVKAAAEQVAAVIVDVDALRVPSPSAWSVLTSAQWMIDVWPAIPICVVATKPEIRGILRDNGITRYLGVFPSYQAVLANLSADQGRRRSHRRRAARDLPRHAAGQGMARDLVRRTLTEWNHPEYIDAAETITTELVRNVLAHTQSAPRLRLELNGDRLTIAVADDSPLPAVRREPVEGTFAFAGLGVVSELSRAWGSLATGDGKVVWAVIGPNKHQTANRPAESRLPKAGDVA